MADNEVIGKVSSASGDVTVTGADGQQKALQVGDEIHANDVVATGADSSVIFEFADGSRKGMPANAEITLNESVYNPATVETPATEGISTGDAMDEEAVESAEPASGTEPIGTLSSASGEVRVQAPDGSERTLETGDPVYSGETVFTGDGSLAIFELSDGSRKGLASNAEIYLEDSILTPETELAAADVPTVEQVEAEMAAEPTAAGGEAAPVAEPIGIIKASSGDITAIGADGSERALADGDEVFAGETILSANASTAIIEYADGATSGLSSNSKVTLDARPAPAAEAPTEQSGGTAVAAAEEAAEQVALGTGIPVGSVTAADGDVIAVAADGSERKLEVGDEVNADETVMAGDNSTAIFNFYDGSSRGLASNSEMTLDGQTLNLAAIRAGMPEGAGAVAEAGEVAPATEAEVPELQVAAAQTAPEVPEGAVAEVEELDEEVAAIQEAIEEGADPSEEEEATAAGETAEDGGHDAVFLARSDQRADLGALDGLDTSEYPNIVQSGLFDPDLEFAPLFSTGGFGGSEPDLLGKIIADLQQTLNDLLDFATSLLASGAITELVRGLLEGLDNFLNDLDVSNLVGKVIDEVQEFLNTVIDATQEFISDLLTNLGAILETVFDTANQLFDRLEELTGEEFPEAVRDLFNQLADTVQGTYSSVSGLVDGLQQETIDNLQASFNEQFDGVQSQLVAGINTVEDPLQENDPGVRDAIIAETGEDGYDIGGRLTNVTNAAFDEVDNTLDANREPDGVYEEGFDVVEAAAETGDELLLGDPETALSDSQVVEEMAGVVDAVTGLATGDLAQSAENIADAAEESLTPPESNDGGGFSTPDPTSSLTMSTSSSSSTDSFDVPGVNPGATSNLMGDGSSDGTISLQSIHVAAEHDSAVFHLSTSELEEGEGGFDIDHFNPESDTLEIADLLGEEIAGGDVSGANLSQYLHVEDDGEGGSTISVTGSDGSTTAIHLQGVDLTHDQNGDLRSDAEIIEGMLAGGSLDITSTGTQVSPDGTLDPGSLFG